MSDGSLAVSTTTERPPLMRLLSDVRLSKLAAAGSTTAFTALYQRHHQAIYRYCHSVTGNEHDARDALQNTMEKAFAALRGESREIAIRPWLFRIAHNESISLLRRRTPDVGLDQAAEIRSTAVNLDARERLRGLISDLDLLTERQRAALVMRELNGLEFAEIATAIETSPDGAKQCVYEARLALHDLERGREMSCEEICGRISADDRRRLQARVVRAHLKSCADCRAFASELDARRHQLGLIAPPLAAPAALSILHGIIGGGGGGGTAVLAGGTGIGVGVGSGFVAKAAFVVLVAAGAGGLVIEARNSNERDDSPTPESTIATPQGTREAPVADAAVPPGAEPAGPAGSQQTNLSPHRSESGSTAASPDAASATHPAADSSGDETAAGPGSSAGEAATDPESGSDAAPVDVIEAPSTPGGGPTGTPPGHGGTPPGQGGTPPGLGTQPPGLGGTPPGQGGTPPGLDTTVPPGQGGTPPGQGLTNPGVGIVPGNGPSADHGPH
jgi:RNA polymerase sigma factor (sigma-70 family)